MSTEQRVYAHWKALKGTVRKNGGNTKDNAIWLTLAAVHKMKVRKIKDIVEAQKPIPKSNLEFRP